MATIMANDFSFFELTPAEYRSGCTLTADNIHCIQNLLCMAATELLNIEDDPMRPDLAKLQRAKLQGEIGAYRSIITNHQHAIDEARTELEDAVIIAKQKELHKSAYASFGKNATTVSPTTELAATHK